LSLNIDKKVFFKITAWIELWLHIFIGPDGFAAALLLHVEGPGGAVRGDLLPHADGHRLLLRLQPQLPPEDAQGHQVPILPKVTNIGLRIFVRVSTHIFNLLC
jgi:hypothetical protein